MYDCMYECMHVSVCVYGVMSFNMWETVPDLLLQDQKCYILVLPLNSCVVLGMWLNLFDSILPIL